MLASLLVSVLLVGIKLTSAKDIVQTIERRKELKANLSMLQRLIEQEDEKAWIIDVAHDTKERMDRIAELESASGLSYDTQENEFLEKGIAMFAVFEASSVGVKQFRHSATITFSETKLDEETGLLLGRSAAMVRATPQSIVAYMLNFDSRFFRSGVRGSSVVVHAEALQHVNAHQTITFARAKVGPGLSQRTFLNSLVAKRVADDPPTYVLVGVPIAQHEKVARGDEKGAVRAENYRAFKLTEVAAGITKLEYACSLNLGGFIPQAITNRVAVPEQMRGTYLV